MADDETNNVIPLLNVLAQRIRAAYERTERGTEEWIEGTLDLAAALNEARARFPSNIDFAVWLAKNELDWLGPNDRAALINIAELPNARSILNNFADAKLRPDTIWQIIKTEDWPRLQMHLKTEVLSQIIEKPVQIPADHAQHAVGSVTQIVGSLFKGLPRATEVKAIYRQPNTRTMIGKAIKERGGREIWELILAAIDAGFLVPTNINPRNANLRLLFPSIPSGYAHQFDLTDQKVRKHVRDVLFPAAILHRDAILAAPDRVEDILTEHLNRQRQEAAKQRQDRAAAQALETMLANQDKVMMFGQWLWPCTDPTMVGSYTYDQLRAACWAFRDLKDWLSMGADNKPGSIAIRIRYSTRWYAEFSDRAYDAETRGTMKRVFSLVHHLSRLFESDPTAECKWPASPTTEGKWP